MSRRIVALDSLRGLAACLIALFHLPNEISSHLLDLARIENIWLYTDFFFVLSGFVIAASYQDRLLAGMASVRFLLMRFGRLYPLHIAVLALFVLRSISLVLFAAAGMQGVQPQFQHEDVVRILSYLGLLQGFPQLRSIAWNSPSWSISGEYCAYVVFAGLLVLCGRRAVYVLALLALLGSGGYWLLMSVPGVDYFDVYVEFGVLRCLSAFCVGAVAWNLQRNMRWPWRGSHEVTVALLAMAIVGASNEATVLLLGPYLCGGLVLVFHRDAGPLTRMLRWTPFRILGPLSYSIYMIHFLLNQLIWDVWRILAPFTGFGAAQEVPVVDNPWTGDVMALLYLLLLIGISTFTYRWIEVPARDWFRRRAGQRPEGI